MCIHKCVLCDCGQSSFHAVRRNSSAALLNESKLSSVLLSYLLTCLIMKTLYCMNITAWSVCPSKWLCIMTVLMVMRASISMCPISWILVLCLISWIVAGHRRLKLLLWFMEQYEFWNWYGQSFIAINHTDQSLEILLLNPKVLMCQSFSYVLKHSRQ